MLSPEVTVLKADQLDQIDTSKSFIFWSHIGVGAVTLLTEQFASAGYHVFRIISPIFSDYDLFSLPMPGGAFAEQKWISELRSIRDSGKKLVLMFDEISQPTKASLDVFDKAVVERVFSSIKLNDDDIVLGVGQIGSDGHLVDTFIPNETLSFVEHYVFSR